MTWISDEPGRRLTERKQEDSADVCKETSRASDRVQLKWM